MTPVELWRCKVCGKWSHAERRPRAHQRVIPGSECPATVQPDCCGPGSGCGGATPPEVVWCGPFERFVAALDDPSPPAPSARIGEPVPASEQRGWTPAPAVEDDPVDITF